MTAAEELHAAAIHALRVRGTPEKALNLLFTKMKKRPALLVEMTRIYLENVLAGRDRSTFGDQLLDVSTADAAGKGQQTRDAQNNYAPPAAHIEDRSSTDRDQTLSDDQHPGVSVNEAAARDQTNIDAQTPCAPPAELPITVRAHRVKQYHRHVPQNEIQKEIARTVAEAVMQIRIDAVFERRIGGKKLAEIHYHELKELERTEAANAALGLYRTLGQVENAILGRLILEHGTPPNEDALIKDHVSAAKLKDLADMARALAPKAVDYLVPRVEKDLLEYRDIA